MDIVRRLPCWQCATVYVTVVRSMDIVRRLPCWQYAALYSVFCIQPFSISGGRFIQTQSPYNEVVRIGFLKIAQFVNFWLTVNVASRYWYTCKNRAVCCILKSHHKTNTCAYFKLVLSHSGHYGHVSTAVAIIIRVIYTITVSPNKLLKCVSETLSVSKLTPKYMHITVNCNRPSSCVRDLRHSL